MSFGTAFTINYSPYTLNYTIITITPTNTVALTGSSGSVANWSLTIPSTVTYNSVTYTVTKVESTAFLSNTNLVSCIIPNSVNNLGTSIFQDSTNLASVTIPSGVKSIPSQIFMNCSALSSITIPSGVTSIGPYCFFNTRLTTVVIPDTVTSLGSGVFNSCTNLTGVKLPLNLTYSGVFTASSAFQSCDALKSVTIPASWTFVPEDCFHICGALTKVTFDSNTNLQYISDYAFSRLNTNSIKLPSSLTSIGHAGLNNCKYVLFTGNIPSISSANFINESDTAYYFTGATNTASLSSFFTTSTALTQNFSVNNINYNFTDIDDSGNVYVSITGNTLTTTTDLSISSNVTNSSIVYTVNNISLGAFQNKSLLTSVTIPNTITRIDSNAFLGCTSLTKVTFNGNIPSIDSTGNFGITGDTAYYYSGSTNTSILSSFFTNQAQLILNFNTTTGGITYNFSSLSGTSVKITSITPDTSITSLSIPSNVINSGTISNIVDINNFVFTGYTNLTNITVNSYLPNFKNGFLGVNNTGLQINFNYTGSIPEGACSGMNKMTSITIPSTITGIEKNSFQDCYGLKSITIPSSVTSIGYTAFKDCSGLTSIAINSYISNLASGLYGLDNKLLQFNFNYNGPISDGACYRKSNMKSITIISSITSLGRSVFEYCYGLTNVTFQPTPQIKIFSNRLFYNCYSLPSLTIPLSVTKIDDYVFTYCSSLTSITIPANVTSIGQYAFSGCSGLTSVTFTSTTTMISIGIYAFQNCTSLTSITIPQTVTNINENIFKGCKILTII